MDIKQFNLNIYEIMFLKFLMKTEIEEATDFIFFYVY